MVAATGPCGVQRLDALRTEIARENANEIRRVTSNAKVGKRPHPGQPAMTRAVRRYDTDIYGSALTDPARLVRWIGEVEVASTAETFRAPTTAGRAAGRLSPASPRTTSWRGPRTRTTRQPDEHAIEATLTATLQSWSWSAASQWSTSTPRTAPGPRPRRRYSAAYLAGRERREGPNGGPSSCRRTRRWPRKDR